MMKRVNLSFTGAALVACVLVAGSCTSGEADQTVTVTGTNDACELDSTEIGAGTVAFAFSNDADEINELYVLKDNGDVVSEVENVTTGTSRTLTVDLAAGDYEVSCKPGMSGDGIKTSFVVVGEGGPEEATIDRTVTFDAHDFGYDGLDLDDIKVGETIRFEMTNSGPQPHEFEVLLPDGDALGEVAAIEKGEEGGATMTFPEAGTYMFQCILIDEESGEPHTALGMVGTFDVAES